MHLDGNALSGTTPENLLLRSQSLIALDIANNNMSGAIPAQLNKLTNLQVLNLRGYHFMGSIPFTLCQLQDLAILNLAQNNLHGPIPPCFHNISALSAVFSTLGVNSSVIASPNNTISILIGEEGEVKFTKGRMYSFTGDALIYMTGLDLSGKKLSCPFPPDMGPLKALKMLNLSNDCLTGPLPNSSHNELSGQIPPQLEKLARLSMFSVANNNLLDWIPSGTQFCTFNESSCGGNPGLYSLQGVGCSNAISHNTSSTLNNNEGEDGDEREGWADTSPMFYACVGLGYVIGLWRTIILLFVNRRWGLACVRSMDTILVRIIPSCFKQKLV
ncbi:hypothetical protein AMTR_s00024p00247180 [Amborella trichopoda]|uniref:Leucine-rich repeat-containing N-terminal plant-type domain-containing protein n=2 Tax=Amborella trichopoda TaxID=13333 RepID=W1PVK1_AMBTC|nr:hypothetical protein AMTR_s00024p00247180 [Amborella trichopoda]